MKHFLSLFMIFLSLTCLGQSNFELNNYKTYLEGNKNMSKTQLLDRYPQLGTYFLGDQGPYNIKEAAFYDSVLLKLRLNQQELKLLKDNHFVVTETHSGNSVLAVMDKVYHEDLPLMITSDVLLHALHNSYDNMLQHVEINYLENNLTTALEKMYDIFYSKAPELSKNNGLNNLLNDAEVFMIIARELLDSNLNLRPQYVPIKYLQKLREIIKNEKKASTELFTFSKRNIDFSQFKPRGHYENGQEEYFQSMIWLSFINIFITKPKEDPSLTAEDIKRMSMLAMFLNQLVYDSGAYVELDENDEIIKYFVGESDNLTPYELKQVLAELSIDAVTELEDDETLQILQTTLKSQDAYQQKILSGIIMTNPLSAEPAPLPITYKLFGQRFVIDSYVLHNTSYDQITYNNSKVLRMMPSPLDVMFCLGNNNAIHLLEKDLDRYPYASSAAAMRYLFDAYDDDYWSSSLYNVWLKTIKCLSRAEQNEHMPFFTQTVAWQHEKLNSQLASWSQLRHDNILYAKQSYTGGVSCSYPYGYVEPYPEFFLNLKLFASDAASFMNKEHFNSDIYETFWNRFASITDTLLELTLKEVNGEPFSTTDLQFIQRALRVKSYGMCGEPPIYDGWLTKLFWDPFEASEDDYTVVDVHTQPTDETGNMVGKVLHTGVGRFNMGIFIAPNPSNKNKPTIFCGPTLSYYEFVSNNFERMTDSEWTEQILYNKLPPTPEWTNNYLIREDGIIQEASTTLKGTYFTDSAYSKGSASNTSLHENIKISARYDGCQLIFSGFQNNTLINISLYNTSGQEIKKLTTNKHNIPFASDQPTVILYRVKNKGKTYSGKCPIN